jgi:hypothetical protein
MFWALKQAFFGTFLKSVITQMANLKYISSFIIFGQTRAIKWTSLSDFLAKKKQLSFNEGVRPIAASIKEGLYY